MADKDLTVMMRLNKSAAEASAQQFHANELARVNRLRDAHGRFVKQGTEDAQKHQAAVSQMGGTFDKVGAQFGQMMAGYATIGVAMGGVRMLAAAWAAVEANTIKTGMAALDYEKQTRALASLQGIDKPSEAVAGALKFAVDTGLPLAKADVYQQAFLGSSPAGLQKGNVSEKTLGDFKVQSAITASRQGADLKVRGDLAGVLGQFKKYDTVEEMMGDMDKIKVALAEGRGTDDELTASLLNLAGSLVGEKGMFKDITELASHLGTQSLSASGLKSDVRTEQAMRGLSGTTAKSRKFLKDFAGIEETDDAETRLAKFMPKLRGEMAKGRTPMGFLQEKLENYEQARALSELEQIYGVQQERLARTRGGDTPEKQKAATIALGRKAMEENKAFRATPGGAMDIAKTTTEAADVLLGEKNKDWLQVQEKARTEWKMAHKDESLATWVNSAILGATRLSSPEAGRERRIGMLGLQKMREQVRGAGLRMTEEEEGEGLEEKGRNIAAFLRRHKIEPGANMTSVQDALDRQTKIMEEEHRENKNAPGPVLNGRPTTAAIAR